MDEVVLVVCNMDFETRVKCLEKARRFYKNEKATFLPVNYFNAEFDCSRELNAIMVFENLTNYSKIIGLGKKFSCPVTIFPLDN